MSIDSLARLREHFTPEQAEAIARAIETQTVTRDYLDSRIESLFNRLLIASLAVAGFSIAAITWLGKVIG